MRKPILGIGGLSLVVGLALVPLAFILFAEQDDGPQFSQWGQAVPVPSPVRSPSGTWDACPFISKSGLDLYFRTEVYTPNYNWDIFVSHRDTVDDPWEDPINLGTNINTANRNEMCSFVTIDGHWLYFVSNRPGTKGSTDIWVSHRADKRDDTGWETPKNLGPNVNTTAGETGPCIFEDEATGLVTLYFTRPVSGKNKIFSCLMLDKETPGPSAPVAELNSSSTKADLHAFVRRRDGLEVIFASDRENATSGMYDLFVSTRPTTSDTWSTPVNLGPLVNDPIRAEAHPSISWDGTTLYFWSDREWFAPGGWYDMKIYQATRTKITGPRK